MDLVTVFRSFSPAEVQLICSALEAAGFRAMINHETDALGYSWDNAGILVQVLDADADAAKEFLRGESGAETP